MSIQMTMPVNRANSGRTLAALNLALGTLAWAAGGPLRLFRFWRTRRELSALAAMSGYELRDIGLTPFDVANAMASSSAEDATEGLARVAQDRRFKRES
jgi:uncharacterized protein YjiS (DUF1127 family)